MNQEGKSKKNISTYVLVLILIMGLSVVIPSQSKCIQAASKPKLNKQSVRLIKGETVKLKLKGVRGKVEWKSTKKAVASVNKKGLVKARKKGSTKIVAKYAGKSYKCKVWVETPQLSKTSLILEEGQTETLSVQGTKQEVTWSSTQPEIASVNEKGVVSVKSVGTAVVTASIGTKNYNCIVIITEKIVELEPQPSGEVTMTVQDEVVTTADLMNTITIENDTGKSVRVCGGYAFERKVDGQWIELSMDEGINEKETDKTLEQGESTFQWIYFNKTEDYRELDVGDYRVAKVVMVEGERRVITAEFSCIQAVLAVSMNPTGSCRIPATQTSFEVELKNYSEFPVSTFLHGKLEKLVDNEWVDWDLGYIYVSVAGRLEGNETKKESITLVPAEWSSRVCEPGKYRIRNNFYLGNQSATLYVNFEIVE